MPFVNKLGEQELTAVTEKRLRNGDVDRSRCASLDCREQSMHARLVDEAKRMLSLHAQFDLTGAPAAVQQCVLQDAGAK